MIINPKTDRLLQAFVSRPSSSLLVVGGNAFGAEEIVKSVAQQLLTGPDRFNVLELRPEEGKGISIDQVREFKRSLTSRIKSTSKVARAAIVFNIDTASTESQNALLKLIEEPVDRTLLILQADRKENLLPTVISRCQTVPILPITRKQAQEYAASHGREAQAASRALMIANGEAITFERLMANEADDTVATIEEAKSFLKAGVFERLGRQKEYDSGSKLLLLLENLERTASAGLHAGNTSQAGRWQKILKELSICRRLLQRNTLVKLVYLRLCVSL